MGAVSDFFADIRFNEFIEALWVGGWYHYIFPFMLVYAIVFTILNYVDLFKDKKPVKVIIALIIAIFSISFPITGDGDSCIGRFCGQTLGDLMMALFPGVTAFAVGILALYIVAAMLGVDLIEILGSSRRDRNTIRWILGGIGLLVVAYYYARGFGWGGFGSRGGWWGDFESFITDPFLLIIILFALFFIWISSDEEDEEKKKRKKEERKARRMRDLEEERAELGRS